MRIVTVFDEQYVLTIPARHMWRMLSEYLHPERMGMTAPKDVLLLGKMVDDNTPSLQDYIHSYQLGSFSPPQVGCMYDEIKNEFYQNNLFKQFSRSYLLAPLCLIPLDRNGVVDCTLQRENPDGTEVSFGQLFRNGVPMRKHLLHRCEVQDILEFRGDSGNPEEWLDWVWLEGKLICTNCILESNALHLANQDLLAHINPHQKVTQQDIERYHKLFPKQEFD